MTEFVFAPVNRVFSSNLFNNRIPIMSLSYMFLSQYFACICLSAFLPFSVSDVPPRPTCRTRIPLRSKSSSLCRRAYSLVLIPHSFNLHIKAVLPSEPSWRMDRTAYSISGAVSRYCDIFPLICLGNGFSNPLIIP